MTSGHMNCDGIWPDKNHDIQAEKKMIIYGETKYDAFWLDI